MYVGSDENIFTNSSCFNSGVMHSNSGFVKSVTLMPNKNDSIFALLYYSCVDLIWPGRRPFPGIPVVQATPEAALG